MADSVLKLPRLQGKVIAIDGPAGAGKSTTARRLAARLGYTYLDTGAMYRALTWWALERGIEPSDADRLTDAARRIPIQLVPGDKGDRVLIDGNDVTREIRSPEVTRHVSEVAAHQGVRQAMVSLQRKLARKGSIVAEGRDTTTVVFPNADIKIYLEATVTERAQRRLLDMAKMGVATTLKEQEDDIRRRDEYDSNRKHSPLTRARDAFVIDTTNLTIEGQVERIIALIKSVLMKS
jgi:cytidylate kinase